MTTGRSGAGISDPVGAAGPASTAKVSRRLEWAAIITAGRSVPSPQAFAAWWRAQLALQADRLVIWSPVAFGLGAAAYLGLHAEPAQWAGWLALAVATILAWLAWRFSGRHAVIVASTLAAVTVLGFLVAKIHSDRVAAPIAPSRPGLVTVDGWVADIDTPSERGERLLIAPVRISGLPPAATPTRIRIVIGAPGGPEAAPPPGSAVRLLTLLDPPPGPAAPGAYDFARDAWFEGLGGVGLAMRQPDLIGLPAPPWRLRLEMAVNALRWSVAERLAHGVSAVLGARDGGAGGLVAAVTTSHQDWLGAGHRDDLRGSGLAHMLAIAGLHTAAVSGFAFFAFRGLIAAWPWLALRTPGKKLAALGALAVVGAYLLLSGAHPPARRAAITAAVAFLAILADRRAVSLQSLAIAALLVLAGEPEAVLQPGFEMSFCATASLVALAEVWPHRRGGQGDRPWPLAMLRAAGAWLLAMAAVSFVAGAATGPFAIQHFNRVSNYGVLANLTADFVASVVLMPSLAVTLIAQAMGLTGAALSPLLWLDGVAARAIIAIGHVFSTAPGAALAMSSAPQIALALSYLGIVFACLWRGPLRWIGLPLSAAVALWPRPAPPVAWIAADGDDAAVVVQGREVTMKPGARAYATGLWAQRRGFSLPDDPGAAQASQFDCNRKGCLPVGAARPALAASWMKAPPGVGRMAELCARADIVILRSATAPDGACGRAIVLTRGDFERGGAAEVFAAPDGWRLVWSQPLRGNRPWSDGYAAVIDSGG